MGMDAVELLMDIEDRFEISIPDAEAQHLDTPRKLIAWVSAAVCVSQEQRCVSQRSFYRVRKLLMAATGVDRRHIGPRTALDSIVPLAARRRRWPAVASLMGVEAGLHRPGWLSFSLTCATAAIGAAVYAQHREAATTAVVVAVVTACAYAMSEPMAVLLRSTVGDLAREAIPALVLEEQLRGRATRWSRTDVAEVIRSLITRYTDNPDFSDDTDFRSIGLD